MNRKTGEQPFYMQIVADLTAQIKAGQFSFDTPICTELTLTERYQVSRITVRHALELLEEDGLITRKRGSGCYVPRNFSLRLMRNENKLAPVVTEHAKIIAVVLPFALEGNHWSVVLHAMTEELTKHGYLVSLHIAQENGENTEQVLLQRLSQLNVAGVVYFPFDASIHLDLLTELMMQGKSVVLLDVLSNCPYLPAVTSDNLNSGKMLTDHLLSLGHRKIAFYSAVDPSERSTVCDRFSGYVLSLSKAGIVPDPNLIFTKIPPERRILPPADMNEIMDTVSAFREAGATAIICEHDRRTYYLMDACKRLGLRIPEDISVACFDNTEWAHSETGMQMTTCEQDRNRIGTEAARRVLDGLSAPIRECGPTIVPTRLIIGTTTAKPAEEKIISLA